VRAPRIPGASDEGRCEAPLDAAAVAKVAAEAGMAALAGQPGATRDALVYGAALCLWHLGRHASPRSAAETVRAVLDRGKALQRLHRAN